jgi:hypothetical protein
MSPEQSRVADLHLAGPGLPVYAGVSNLIHGAATRQVLPVFTVLQLKIAALTKVWGAVYVAPTYRRKS